MSIDIGQLAAREQELFRWLENVKRQMGPQPFEWYKYYSLGNLPVLDKLLHGSHRDLAILAGDSTVLDFGCADGDLAFALEAEGLKVMSFDHPRTNHNGMMGVKALRNQLGSKIGVRELDLDEPFEIPEGNYGLALVLGILYHLRNPLYVLEQISKKARYCLLSTRIARFLPDGKTDISQSPVAYLLGETELNDDNSNYWIFSSEGLKRLVARANWRVVDFMTVGDTEGSLPVTLEHDERAFCLLESVYAMGHLDLVEGFHHPEPEGWRWTERRFVLRLSNASRFDLKLYVSPEMIEKLGPVTLSAKANQVRLAPATYDTPGYHSFARGVRKETATEVVFELDKAFPPGNADVRELGIVVARLDVD